MPVVAAGWQSQAGHGSNKPLRTSLLGSRSRAIAPSAIDSVFQQPEFLDRDVVNRIADIALPVQDHGLRRADQVAQRGLPQLRVVDPMLDLAVHSAIVASEPKPERLRRDPHADWPGNAGFALKVVTAAVTASS